APSMNDGTYYTNHGTFIPLQIRNIPHTHPFSPLRGVGGAVWHVQRHVSTLGIGGLDAGVLGRSSKTMGTSLCDVY
ncbi:hypothetical protein, partial [Xylanibacter muris]|uniref:hypothetical protein n=1 Tax=Xylanibacter muris TaxID=2736290 RepID=UPI001C12E58B